MAGSKVYFTDFRTTVGTSLTVKMQKLIRKAGIGSIDMDGKFVAIKMHFGELGNLSYLRPNYAKAVADVVKDQGGIPFLTDCNTLYPGSRKNALEHMDCANINGFNTITTGCQIIIGDGLRSTPMPNSQLSDNLKKPGWHHHHDHFFDSNPNVRWKETLEHAEKIGLGTREYELITM